MINTILIPLEFLFVIILKMFEYSSIYPSNPKLMHSFKSVWMNFLKL